MQRQKAQREKGKVPPIIDWPIRELRVPPLSLSFVSEMRWPRLALGRENAVSKLATYPVKWLTILKRRLSLASNTVNVSRLLLWPADSKPFYGLCAPESLSLCGVPTAPMLCDPLYPQATLTQRKGIKIMRIRQKKYTRIRGKHTTEKSVEPPKVNRFRSKPPALLAT